MSVHSKESICNSALGLLGKPPLVVDAAAAQDYGDADAAVRAYEDRFGRVLRSHLWNFAETRVQLNADSVTPDFGFRFRYALPATPPVARVWGLDPVRHGRDPKYRVAGGYVLSDEPAPLNLIYIARITDPSLFDDAFADAFASEIAAKIALKVLGSVEAASQFRKDGKEDFRDARTVDAQENKPQELDEGSWLYRRRTG